MKIDEVLKVIKDSSYDEALKSLDKELASRKTFLKGQYICFLEANLFSHAIDNKNIRNVLVSSHALYPDGISVSLAAKIKYGGKYERISGPTFLLKACEYGQSLNWRHFFYGSDEETCKKLIKNLKENYHDIVIAGYHAPPFRDLNEHEKKNIIKLIESAKPDLLWVGLGGPKQEYWMNETSNYLQVPFMLGIGAAFDFHSGKKAWAPKYIRKIGMEWLFRAFTGGWMTFKRNVICCTKITLYLIKSYFHKE